MGRIETICSHLPRTDVFADVGCDHGYCTKYMLDNRLCRRAYLSDISAESLAKARALLQEEIASGICIPVVADGLHGIPSCDCVLIAGMGGEEIIHILSECAIPPEFVLQPMKNTDKVRAFLLERGCRITLDYTFEDGKFYDILAGKAVGGDRYDERELKFGRDNLRSPTDAFIRKIKEEREKLQKRLEVPSMNGTSREALRRKQEELEELLNEIGANL